jgi:glutathione peroxidase-family protein
MSLFSLPDATLSNGETLNMSTLEGKPALAMNVASCWGSTGRGYKYLGELRKTFGEKISLLVLPSGEFGGQELKTDEQIAEFVSNKGLPTSAPGSFLMAKTTVKGAGCHPIIALGKSVFPGEIGWNFDGIFVFDKEGKPCLRRSIRQPPSTEELSKLM